MTPNTWRETLFRELHRFGHVSWVRRVLERCGVVRREETVDEFVKRQWAAGRSVRVVVYPHSTGLWADLDAERRKQDPEVWQAADRARRGSE